MIIPQNAKFCAFPIPRLPHDLSAAGLFGIGALDEKQLPLCMESSAFGQSSKRLPEEFRHRVTLRPGRALSELDLMDLLGAILLVVAAVGLTVYLIRYLVES